MRFNRTFMELKCLAPSHPRTLAPRFNRTFMELKYGTPAGRIYGNAVLIVPLWN